MVLKTAELLEHLTSINLTFIGGWPTLIILGILALLTYVVDFAATAFGAKRFGASKRATIGAVFGELSARRDLKAATRAGVGATIGLAIGAAAKLALAFSMVGIFVVARFF